MSCTAFAAWSENGNVCANCKQLKCPAKASIDMEAELVKVFRSAITRTYPGLANQLPKLLITKGRGGADYQCNNAPGLVKQLSLLDPPIKTDKDKVAASLIEAAKGPIVAEANSVKGFINVKISKEYVQNSIQRLVNEGVQPPAVQKKRILVDFSSPNIAKKMHVGHLRSTIIGDTVCRLFEFCGHDVERVNHVGDWGTQFGMLITHLKSICPDFLTSPPDVNDLAQFYKDAKNRFDAEPDFKKQSHEEVVKLQSGDAENLAAWKLMCDISRREFAAIYDRLDVVAEERGESFYNPIIPDVLQKLRDLKLTKLNEGATLLSAVDWKNLDDKKLGKDDVKKCVGFAMMNAKGKEKVNPVLLAEAAAADLAKEEDGEWMLKVGKEFKACSKMAMEDFDKFLVSCKDVITPKAGTLNEKIKAELTKIGSYKDGKIGVPTFSIPLIAQKSDGGFSYDTTDLAAVWHRCQVSKANRIICITDKGQGLHFDMIFRAAQDAGWDQHEDGSTIRFDHVGFGVVCGEDKKRYRTRSGETAALADLLDEGVARSLEQSTERQVEKIALHKELMEKGEQREPYVAFTDAELQATAEVVGIGAIKYCDLRQNRNSDYVFDSKKMCSLNGNTVMAMMYSYVRTCSLAKKAGVDVTTIRATPVNLQLDSEKTLAVHLLRFSGVVSEAVWPFPRCFFFILPLAPYCLSKIIPTQCESLLFHSITDYLYELSNVFNECYNNKEWKVVGSELQNSRLLLCEATGATIKKGLELLGIKVVTRL